jgi:hypothetical protein
MVYVIAYAILFPIVFVIWVVALTLYNMVIGGFEIGAVGPFAGKSAVLVAIVSLILFLPFGQWIALGVWWIGIAVAFGVEFWEAKVLAVILWALTFVTFLGLRAGLSG